MEQLMSYLQEQFGLIQEQFVEVHHRFEQVDRRFEQVDRRFDQMQVQFEERFEKLELNQQLMIAELRAHKRETNDKFAEMKTTFLQSQQQFQLENDLQFRNIDRRIDQVELNLTKAIVRIEKLEESTH